MSKIGSGITRGALGWLSFPFGIGSFVYSHSNATRSLAWEKLITNSIHCLDTCAWGLYEGFSKVSRTSRLAFYNSAGDCRNSHQHLRQLTSGPRSSKLDPAFYERLQSSWFHYPAQPRHCVLSLRSPALPCCCSGLSARAFGRDGSKIRVGARWLLSALNSRRLVLFPIVHSTVAGVSSAHRSVCGPATQLISDRSQFW